MQPRIIAGAAAAVVFVTDVDERLRPEDASDRFMVHPHVEDVSADDPALLGYLAEVYEQPTSIGAEYPSLLTFAELREAADVGEATRAMAEALARAMASKSANRGILFGCLLELADGSRAHGIIKVDLDQAVRFHFSADNTGGWSLDEVRDMLPPPKQNFAKYVIAPQPGGDRPAGIRDENSRADSAADYLLEAVGLVVPRLSGTKARVGNEALRSNVSVEAVHRGLSDVTEDTNTTDVFARHFDGVGDDAVARAAGSETRPMPRVVADDPYVRVYETRRPKFKLEVGPEVEVERQGNRLIITLPADADDIEIRLR